MRLCIRSRCLGALALALSSACTGGATPEPTPSPVATALPTQTPVPVATPVPTATPAATPVPTEEFEIDRAMAHVRVLAADIGHRQAGSEGDERAARYQAEVLSGLGLEVTLHPFELPQGGQSWNVIGRPPAFAFDRPYLLVGGHTDSLNGPGANDNATGIAVSLEAMRALAAEPANLPVVYAGLGAEERQPYPERVNHVGSRHYVSRMTEAEKANLVAFLNVDMVGRGETLLICRMKEGPREATQRLLRLGAERQIPVKERVTPNWSDNGTFLETGLNAGWIWAGEDAYFHSPRDTYNRVQPSVVERAGRLTLAFLRSY